MRWRSKPNAGADGEGKTNSTKGTSKKKKTTGNMLNVYSLDLMCKVTQQLICTFGRMI